MLRWFAGLPAKKNRGPFGSAAFGYCCWLMPFYTIIANLPAADQCAISHARMTRRQRRNGSRIE
jgi:hypothetical protein